MLSRVAFRKVLANSRALPQTQALRAQSFHSSLARSEEKKDATDAIHPGFLTQYGLDDWKITAPIAAALTVPLIHKGVRVNMKKIVYCY